MIQRESSRFSNCDIKKSQFIAANDTLWKSMEIQQFAFENGPLISMSYLVNLVIFQLANCSIVRSKYSDLLPWKMGPQSKPLWSLLTNYPSPEFHHFCSSNLGSMWNPNSILSHPIGSKPHETPIFLNSSTCLSWEEHCEDCPYQMEPWWSRMESGFAGRFVLPIKVTIFIGKMGHQKIAKGRPLFGANHVGWILWLTALTGNLSIINGVYKPTLGKYGKMTIDRSIWGYSSPSP